MDWTLVDFMLTKLGNMVLRGMGVVEAAAVVDMERGVDCAGLAVLDEVGIGCSGRLEERGSGLGVGEGDGDGDIEPLEGLGLRGSCEGVDGERPACNLCTL